MSCGWKPTGSTPVSPDDPGLFTRRRCRADGNTTTPMMVPRPEPRLFTRRRCRADGNWDVFSHEHLDHWLFTRRRCRADGNVAEGLYIHRYLRGAVHSTQMSCGWKHRI